MSAINLGDKVRDQISGVVGIATGRTEFLYGCMRISVTPCEQKEGKPAEGCWFDEPQLVLVKAKVITRPAIPAAAEARTHGPRQDAVRAVDAKR